MVGIDKARDKTERLGVEVGQAVGRATGSMETQVRGIVADARGKALEAVASLKDDVEREAGEAEKQLADARGKALEAVASLRDEVEREGGEAQKRLAEARGRALEAVASLKGEVEKEAGQAQKQLFEMRGNAKTAVTEHSTTSIAVAVVGVLVVLGILAAWIRARRRNARARQEQQDPAS